MSQMHVAICQNGCYGNATGRLHYSNLLAFVSLCLPVAWEAFVLTSAFMERDYRNVWSAAELQAKNEEWQLVCANVFGL
jgi:hypothetical protein